jgi:hypothetical protein
LGKAFNLSNVPAEYQDLRDDFNKARVTALPPYRPHDCVIDLLPVTTPPQGRLYSLSGPETTAMKGYIEDSLAAGCIRPYISPADRVSTTRALMTSLLKNLLQGATIVLKLGLSECLLSCADTGRRHVEDSFNTSGGNYEYLVMPFGLINAPAVFQALVNNVLGDMPN